MSRLSQLAGKPKAYTIGGLQLELKPRTMKDLDLLVDLTKEEKRGEALRKLINVSLKEAVPDATDEELDNVGTEYFQELSEAIIDVNGLKDGKR